MRRQRLGQHYLVDPAIVRRIVEVAHVQPGERVLEIGTGLGVLTKELVRLGKSFEGYEVDKENHEATRAMLAGTGAKLHLGDAFEDRPDFDVLVASLPYSRSAEFVEWLGGIEYDRAVVLLQEDFVRKVLAPPGSRDYRAVSALAQISSDVEELGRVGRSSFSPPPRVNSLIVRINPKVTVSAKEASMVKKLFSLRRRQVASVLVGLGMAGESGGYGTRRVYSLTPEEVHRLCSQ
jgi:16S rRNA (adenine1518-N6/adenine1519-N6)-dimethyltransferase